MQKIPTLFVRDPDDRAHVLPEVTPGCEWVMAGEGVATRKYDGTCVMFDGTAWWARREVKPGKTPPPNYQPISTDETTGKTVGWEPIEQSAFAKYFEQALNYARSRFARTPAGTYELVGPKVNGNPEGCATHELIFHGTALRIDIPERTWDSIRFHVAAMAGAENWEGLVFHHPDGRMAKIKYRDLPDS